MFLTTKTTCLEGLDAIRVEFVLLEIDGVLESEYSVVSPFAGDLTEAFKQGVCFCHIVME